MTATKIRTGANMKIAIGPANAIAKWPTKPSGRVRLYFTYWAGLEKELPKELQPTLGPELTPHLVADSADHAKKITAAIKAWLLAKHPGLTQKKSKELTRFIVAEKEEHWVQAHPEKESDLVLDAIYKAQGVLPWTIGGDAKQGLIMWASGPEVRVTISNAEVRFEADDSVAEYHAPPTKYGTLSIDDGVLGAIALDNTFANLREPVAPAMLKDPKKPTLLKGKKYDDGDAFLAKIEKGTYTVEVGPDVAAKLRWLSLKRIK